MAEAPRRGMTVRGYLTVLTAFGVAMGYMEAVIVYYLRRLLGLVPLPEAIDPAMVAHVDPRVISVEQTREVATIIILASLAVIAGRNNWQRLGTFLFAFGVWDIFYYVGLKALLDWPGSLTSPDLLFLIPRPWYAPVWLPIIISLGLIAAGVACIRAGSRRTRAQ